MDIIARTPETFDAILKKCKDFSKEFLKQRLEIFDLEIFSLVDRRRFEVIRIDERSILTTCGIVTFKRRYYYDHEYENYVYLLDNQLGIPKNVRMSNELLLKILDLASIMTYSEVGKHLSDEFVLSKYTIWKAISETVVESFFNKEINRGNLKVHLQIDEKFINMSGHKKRNEKSTCKHKKRYYTVTIFAGKENGKLLNKTLISSANLENLKERVNHILLTRYKVNFYEEIFVSGDYASYIQNFDESLYCRAKYVPDKFHTFKAIRDAIPDIFIDEWSINDPDCQQYLIKNMLHLKDDNVSKVRRAMRRNPKIFESYLDPEYLGCSQEAQNSHIYAPRFGKYANRFNPETIEKLSLVREACSNNATIKVVNSKRIIEPILDLSYLPEYKITFDEPLRDILDTTNMKKETRKMFNDIKYGLL